MRGLPSSGKDGIEVRNSMAWRTGQGSPEMPLTALLGPMTERKTSGRRMWRVVRMGWLLEMREIEAPESATAWKESVVSGTVRVTMGIGYDSKGTTWEVVGGGEESGLSRMASMAARAVALEGSRWDSVEARDSWDST